MIGQLALAVDVGDGRALVAAITDLVLHERHHYTRGQPADAACAAARASMAAGDQLLLDWLATRTRLPESWLDWPCSACQAAPGEPCDIPNRHRRDRWHRDNGDERHHLARGLDGRWSSVLRAGGS